MGAVIRMKKIVRGSADSVGESGSHIHQVDFFSLAGIFLHHVPHLGVVGIYDLRPLGHGISVAIGIDGNDGGDIDPPGGSVPGDIDDERAQVVSGGGDRDLLNHIVRAEMHEHHIGIDAEPGLDVGEHLIRANPGVAVVIGIDAGRGIRGAGTDEIIRNSAASQPVSQFLSIATGRV